MWLASLDPLEQRDALGGAGRGGPPRGERLLAG
jgi:hypothetical protein